MVSKDVTGRGWDPYSGPVPRPCQEVSVMDRRKQYHFDNLPLLWERTLSVYPLLAYKCMYVSRAPAFRFSLVGMWTWAILNVGKDLSAFCQKKARQAPKSFKKQRLGRSKNVLHLTSTERRTRASAQFSPAHSQWSALDR